MYPIIICLEFYQLSLCIFIFFIAGRDFGDQELLLEAVLALQDQPPEQSRRSLAPAPTPTPIVPPTAPPATPGDSNNTENAGILLFINFMAPTR